MELSLIHEYGAAWTFAINVIGDNAHFNTSLNRDDYNKTFLDSYPIKDYKKKSCYSKTVWLQL
ncbi:hypothetical protein WN55_04027 [Dufourea novaeangliae]|uniref:Uncharacterized protein n=1 Tax=Dufourea novaeangliae TaxID=178035 RepID=A0A154PKU0_DUFNO|nr:hypothetical protein WN55_04027 [Dufourea novaeangliae]